MRTRSALRRRVSSSSSDPRRHPPGEPARARTCDEATSRREHRTGCGHSGLAERATRVLVRTVGVRPARSEPTVAPPPWNAPDLDLLDRSASRRATPGGPASARPSRRRRSSSSSAWRSWHRRSLPDSSDRPRRIQRAQNVETIVRGLRRPDDQRGRPRPRRRGSTRRSTPSSPAHRVGRDPPDQHLVAGRAGRLLDRAGPPRPALLDRRGPRARRSAARASPRTRVRPRAARSENLR